MIGGTAGLLAEAHSSRMFAACKELIAVVVRRLLIYSLELDFAPPEALPMPPA